MPMKISNQIGKNLSGLFGNPIKNLSYIWIVGQTVTKDEAEVE